MMRPYLASLVLLLGTQLLTSTAHAQKCGYLLPPCAPDFRNTIPFYYTSPYGITYGPNYYVRPPFEPFQGMLPLPQNAPPPVYVPYYNPTTGGTMMGMYQPPAHLPIQGQNATAAFPNHLYARSPRDWYLYDTDPRASSFTYGLTSQAGRSLPPERPGE